MPSGPRLVITIPDTRVPYRVADAILSVCMQTRLLFPETRGLIHVTLIFLMRKWGLRAE